MDFKKVSEISAVVISFLIVCSCIQLATYYSYWGVSIFDYITAGELLVLFVRPIQAILWATAQYIALQILFLSVIVAIVLIHWFWEWMRPKKVAVEGAKDGATKKSEDPTWFKVLAGIVSVVATAWMLIVALVEYEAWAAVVGHSFVFVGAAYLVKRLFPETKSQIFTAVIAGAITLLSASYFHGRFQAHWSATTPMLQSLALTDGSTIVCGGEVLYLGKTSGYYFLYDKDARATLIIGATQVKSISVPNTER